MINLWYQSKLCKPYYLSYLDFRDLMTKSKSVTPTTLSATDIILSSVTDSHSLLTGVRHLTYLLSTMYLRLPGTRNLSSRTCLVHAINVHVT